MDGVGQFFEHARTLVEHHAPQDMTVPVLTSIAACLVSVGLGVSVLGARLARGSLTLGLCLAGIASGFAVSVSTGMPQAVAVPLGGLVFGVLGFVLHRLWVGLAAGTALILVLSGTYGVHSLSPQVEAYRQSAGPMPAAFSEGLTFADAGPDAEYIAPEFKQWVGGLWDNVRGNERRSLRKLALINGCLGLFGLILGLLAVRLTLVTMTSLVGTGMILAGAVPLIQTWQPDLYQTGIEHPEAVGISCGVFLLASFVLQFLLTRPDKKAAPAPKT